ncbi:helicase C-terminal domain-containing protein [Enterococcus sp.]|uniref:helicase C-terminal domain-containing protein n=1 Tax=Enterococcus sp. TaxID=35783 RepID=UPI0028969AC3|nr:helicase C-terminal domain-containing protein [Enterococcus sp.]
MKPIYAVVDLETTGTDAAVDRIIQFGCVLVQDGKVINRFATDINPDRRISRQIQNLTHITNQQVKQAPYFEDVADIIFNLLSNTIFVAHNIYFDYQFLSNELVRCGLPALTIPGIDTVELAQVFLPTESSFRLGDLADSIGFVHENPHQADSDAEVTAALLMYIEAIMKELPRTTLKQIALLSGQMGMQTSAFIHAVLKETATTLPDGLEEVDGIVLCKKESKMFAYNHYHKPYPEVKAEKMAQFGPHLAYRKQQARLMNAVYNHYSQTEKNLILEAETGMGKTIGYLFPAAYLATPDNPMIVSTSSILLQNQIMDKDVPLVNQVLDQPIQATVIKSHRHYIDLQRFKATLDQPVDQKQYAQYQMGILVWLTKTISGDFDELNLVRLDHPIFTEIRHRGLEFLSDEQAFYRHDFLRHVYQQAAQSNVLIVNHAFLLQETRRREPLLPASDYLLIDEAQQLPSQAEGLSQYSFDSAYFKRQYLQFNEDGLFDQAANVLDQEQQILPLFNLYRDALAVLIDTQEDFFGSLDLASDVNQVLQRTDLFRSDVDQDRTYRKLILYYQEITEMQQRLQHDFTELHVRTTAQQRLLIARLLDYFEQFQRQAYTVTTWLDSWHPRYVHWLKLHPNQRTATIELADLEGKQVSESIWYQRYSHIIFLGGTLRIPGNKTYYAQQIGIPETPVKTIPAFYDYEKQARLYVVKQGISIQQASTNEYADFLAEALTPLLFEQKQPTLVLFTAHDTLKAVYDRLHKKALNQGRELIAQGTGGSREKILKKFLLAENGLLFGTNSFWEGVDLPGQSLKIAVVTRLPFENPQNPLVKARHQYLTAQGIDTFKEDALPKAILRLRQALGRLIRSEKDAGVMVVLDRRLLSTKYGKRMVKGLPKKLPLIEATPSEMTEDIRHFFEQEDQSLL